MVPAEEDPHLGQEPVVGRMGQVSDAKARRVGAGAGAAAGHDRDSALSTQGDQPGLAGGGVDGVHDMVDTVQPVKARR